MSENLKLNLGCGSDIKQNYINVDKLKFEGVDKVHDLDKFPYPFKNNSAEEIYCSHVLEHVENYEKTLKEIRRILKRGGILHIKVPHFSAPCAYSEFHRRFFWYNSFTSKRIFKESTSLESRDYADFWIKSKKINFEKNPFIWNYLIEPLINLKFMPQFFEHTILKDLFPAHEIEAILVKK